MFRRNVNIIVGMIDHLWGGEGFLVDIWAIRMDEYSESDSASLYKNPSPTWILQILQILPPYKI